MIRNDFHDFLENFSSLHIRTLFGTIPIGNTVRTLILYLARS